VDLPGQLRRPWLMVPGFFYGENRRIDQLGKTCPRFDPAVAEPSEMTANRWDFPADRTAAPLVYAHAGGRCFAVASEPHYGQDGEVRSDDPEPQVGVGFGHDGTSGTIRFSIPACDEPFTYTNSPANAPTIRRVRIAPGAGVSGRLYVHDFAGRRHDYQRVLEHYWRAIAADHPPAEVPEIAALTDDAIHGILAGHYLPEENYFIYCRPYHPVLEQIANARGTTIEWHQMLTGFVGGFMICHSLLAGARITGNDDARRAAIRVADRICAEGLSPSGLFWADLTPRTVNTPAGPLPNPLFGDRNEWGSGWLSGTTRVHSRTISDACDHLAAMLVAEQRDRPDNPSLPLWREALAKNLRTALDLQLPCGCYGQYYDAVARTVIKEDGCGGLLWIPAMLKALDAGVGDEALAGRMKDSVVRAAEGYAPYVRDENIWGAPEDNDSPTSEDGMNAVMAYCDLYAWTGDARMLELARTAADWMLTFRKTYNQIMPADSLIGRYGLRSKGGDYASVSNNHLHVFEVLCTRHLCRLSEWTGSDYYRARAREHWGFVCQFLSRCDGMFNGFRGAMAEQFYWCDYGSWGRWRPADCYAQKGAMAPMTAVWCIAVLPLGAADVMREFPE